MEEKWKRIFLVLTGILVFSTSCFKKTEEAAPTVSTAVTDVAVEDSEEEAPSEEESEAVEEEPAPEPEPEPEPEPSPSPSPTPEPVPPGTGINGYTLGSASVITYAEISGGTAAVFGSLDDGNAYVSLGFSFPFYGNSYSEVALETNGRLSFISPQAAFFSDYSNDSYATMADIPTSVPINSIYFWWDDLYAQAGSVTYLTEGTAGSRYFTVQYKDLQRYGFATSVIDVQVRLSEELHTIEILYGEGAALPNFSATAGIRGSVDGTVLQPLGMLACNPVCATEFPANKKYIFTPNAD